MYKANLSFAQLNDYVKFMLKTGLINKFRANEKNVYAATEKGLEFLQRHMELTELLQENGNGKNGVKIPPQNLLKRNWHFLKILLFENSSKRQDTSPENLVWIVFCCLDIGSDFFPQRWEFLKHIFYNLPTHFLFVEVVRRVPYYTSN